MIGMFNRFKSRKFLLALAALGLETAGVSVPPEVLTLVGVYIGGESIADAAGALAAQRSGRRRRR